MSDRVFDLKPGEEVTNAKGFTVYVVDDRPCPHLHITGEVTTSEEFECVRCNIKVSYRLRPSRA